MNLFDYIKYQGVNLSSEEEIIKLPEELIKKYYFKIYFYVFGCDRAARWTDAESISLTVAMWCNRVDVGYQRAMKVYMEALEDYCDEPF